MALLPDSALSRRSIMKCIVAASIPALLPVRAFAEGLEPATSEPLLTVSGKIKHTNHASGAVFDRAMLENLGAESLTTLTPWFDGPQKFEGFAMEKLLQRVGASGTMVRATALNNYSALIPRDDFVKYHVVVALKRNGQVMSVKEKGPLFIIYPFDSNPDTNLQSFYARCVWQLAQLEVL